MHVRFVGLGRQNLLDLVYQRDVVVEDLVDRLEGELDHILDIGPLMLLLRKSNLTVLLLLKEAPQ